MDSAYKKIFVKVASLQVEEALPSFKPVRIQRMDADHERYSGSLLFNTTLGSGRKMWLLLEPEEGVSRRFLVSFGWTVTAAGTPLGFADDDRLLDATEPIGGIPGGWLGLEQLEGHGASGGFLIPSPWDALLTLPLSAPKAAERALMMECDRAAKALTDPEREAAVVGVVADVVARVQAQLPHFELALERLP